MNVPKIAGDAFELDSRTIHVWSVRIEASTAITAQFERVLSLDERRLAARFRFEHLRRSFFLVRGTLRTLLGGYLNLSPARIQFKYGSKGKPALETPTMCHFNASHSGDLAMFAFTSNCEIGVDVEQLRPIPNMQAIADRFFCSEEAAELMPLATKQRDRAFFRCWTRKEAFVKAIGDGLSMPLDDFRVTLLPSQPPRFIHLAHDTLAAKEWKLHDVPTASNYAAALAYRDQERPVALLPILDPVELLSVLRPKVS